MLRSTRPQLLELPTPNALDASLASKTEAELWPPYHLPYLAKGRAGQKKERKLAKFAGSGSEPEKTWAGATCPLLPQSFCANRVSAAGSAFLRSRIQLHVSAA